MARPVSFVTGWSLLSEGRADQTEGMVAYTLFSRGSLGIHYSRYRLPEGRKREFATPVAHWLVNRWNWENTQANLYLSGGFGSEWTSGAATRGTSFLGIEADVETRRLLFAIRAETVGAGSGSSLSYGRARAGFAPYLAGFEGLHSWGILQLDYRDWSRETELTPLLRLFYQNVMLELGASLTGRLNLNWVIEL